MTLNFSFQNWGQSCQNNPKLCVEAIGVHVFGHAIGFLHEQSRPDTPGECFDEHGKKQEGVELTPYDPASVMNYCNPKYDIFGNLSALDISAVQRVYGAP